MNTNPNPKGIMYDLHEIFDGMQLTRIIEIKSAFEYPNAYLESLLEKEPEFLGGR